MRKDPLRVMIVFPSQLGNVDSGAQLRCVEVIRGLMLLGCDVRLLHRGPLAGGFTRLAENGPRFQQRSIETTRLDRFLGRLLGRLAAMLTGRPRVAYSIYAGPFVRAWFRSQVSEYDPNAIFMVYLHPHHLLRSLPTGRRPLLVLDAHDLTSRLQAIYRAAIALVGHEEGPARTVADADLRVDYYDTPAFAPVPEEFRLIGAYDVVAAISPIEAEIIAATVPRVHVTYLPLTCKTVATDAPHDGGPMSVLPFHPIILHCYLYFARRVLPLVRRVLPGFRLRVVGTNSTRFPVFDGIDLVGYVPDLDAELTRAPFMVLPVFGMTGQQTRIITAMSRGVPVVTLRKAAEAAGVVHMVNGMVADDAEDLAGHIVYLCGRPDECRRLGAAAKQTVEADFSDSKLLSALRTVLGSALP